MSTMTLETCPFCGTDDHETSPWPSGDEWICRCGNPDCAVEVTAETPEAAVAKWNRRAHLSQPAQTVDVGAILNVIEQMRKASMQCAMPPHYQGGCYTAWIDALTSAISGGAGPVGDGWHIDKSNPTNWRITYTPPASPAPDKEGL